MWWTISVIVIISVKIHNGVWGRWRELFGRSHRCSQSRTPKNARLVRRVLTDEARAASHSLEARSCESWRLTSICRLQFCRKYSGWELFPDSSVLFASFLSIFLITLQSEAVWKPGAVTSVVDGQDYNVASIHSPRHLLFAPRWLVCENTPAGLDKDNLFCYRHCC